jgi:hypothetical protein
MKVAAEVGKAGMASSRMIAEKLKPAPIREPAMAPYRPMPGAAAAGRRLADEQIGVPDSGERDQRGSSDISVWLNSAINSGFARPRLVMR